MTTASTSTNIYRRHLVPTRRQEEKIAHFCALEAIDETQYNAMAYTSSPQIPQHQRTVSARVAPSATLSQETKKHPITVPTPR